MLPAGLNESLLHFIWKMRLFHHGNLRTTEGEPLQIMHPGLHNHHSGPDFSNARIKIGSTIWAGNVELHITSRQWLEHGHQLDDAYNNVILHVVYRNNLPDFHIPTLELEPYINQSLILHYRQMMETGSWIPCAKHHPLPADLPLTPWLERISVLRLEEKAIRLQTRLEANKGDWNETSWQLLARSMGNPVNAEPMEQLSRKVTYSIMRRHAHEPTIMESILLGTAGMLQGSFAELYPNKMQSDFKHWQRKYNLTPMEGSVWKFGRMRPTHFPTIRISQLSAILHQTPHLFDSILHGDGKALHSMLEVSASPYWQEHYHFHKSGITVSRKLGKQMIASIIINSIVPLRLLYAQLTDNTDKMEDALQLLSTIAAENNAVIRGWKQLGWEPENAVQTQALLHLYKDFCTYKRCLECQIGYHVLGKISYI